MPGREDPRTSLSPAVGLGASPSELSALLRFARAVARITNIDEFEDLLGIPAKVLWRIRLRARALSTKLI